MPERKPPKEPDNDRVLALRTLPGEIMKTLTKEEVNAFLNEDVWPDSLHEKLKDYLVEDD